MVAICRQGWCVLIASLSLLGFGGCTFDEDELHGLPEAGVEVATDVADVAAAGHPDGSGIDSGVLDASRIDAGRVDAGADVPMPGPIDGGDIDGQRIDVAADTPLGGLDVAIDAPAIGTSPIDAGTVDGARIDVARAEAARRDGPGRDG
jgi:hypothetical protein